MSANAFALARATRGPLVLITLGVLFAIDQAGGVPFHRTWPVLFIVFGVLKLIERLLAPPLPPAPQYYPSAPPPGPRTWPPPPQTGGQA
jgi:hypothetical protein